MNFCKRSYLTIPYFKVSVSLFLQLKNLLKSGVGFNTLI